MDAIKMRRTVRRTKNTKLINESAFVLESKASQDIVSLRSLYDRLSACNKELKVVNDKIETLILSDDLEADLITKVEC